MLTELLDKGNDKIEIDELAAMIPSETVRSYILETGWTFTDHQKAVLLYNQSGLPWREQVSCWRGLMAETRDEGLRAKIEDHLRYEEQSLCKFRENEGRWCIYILKVREEGGFWDGTYLPYGYFSDWETAFKYGKKEASAYTIEKYLVDGTEEFEDGICSHPSLAEISFDKDGNILSITGTEVSDIDEEDLSWYFTRPYFEVPNPYERGDIVKTLWGTYGIVNTTKKEWEEYTARHIGMETADYTDILIGMVWFDEK